MGIGATALAWLTAQEAKAIPAKLLPKDPASFDLKPKTPHFAPRAKAMISLFQHGGPSHVDLFDPKPELTRLSGTDYPGEIVYSFVNGASKSLFGSPWKFSKHGQSGTEISELLPNLGEIVDDVCLIRSMHTGANGHEVSIRYFHGGIPGVVGRPTLGSWLVYGLGCESQELPAYLVLTDPGRAAGRRRHELVERVHASLVPGHGAAAEGAADFESRSAAAFARRGAEAESRFSPRPE